MPAIESTISANSDGYRANREGMLALLARIRDIEERVRQPSASEFLEFGPGYGSAEALTGRATAFRISMSMRRKA